MENINDINPLWVLLGFLGVFFFLIFLAKGVYVVRQQTARVVERLGKFRRVLHPGFHLVIPFIDRVSAPVSPRIVQLDIKVDAKTEDNMFVKPLVAVQYQVNL